MAMHDTFRVKHAVYRTVPCSYRVVVVTKTCAVYDGETERLDKRVYLILSYHVQAGLYVHE